MRQVTLENLADIGVNENGGKIAVKAAKMHGRNVVNAAKSLDLLRQNIQSAINNDIDRVIKKYLDVSLAKILVNYLPSVKRPREREVLKLGYLL